MFNFLKSEIEFPEKKHPSLQDRLREKAMENAQPGIGNLNVFATWDDYLRGIPLDNLFFTALNDRACILLVMSETAVKNPDVIEQLINLNIPWIIHFSAFLEGKYPILRANYIFPDDLDHPYVIESPLDLSLGNIQDFCKAAMADETIDFIIKHQSIADGYHALAFSANGIAKLLDTEARAVIKKIKPGLSQNDFQSSYGLLQQVYPSNTAGIEKEKTVQLKFAGTAKNRFMRYDPFETPEEREEREKKEDQRAQEQTQKEFLEYIERLAAIPEPLGSDRATCREIGEEINQRWGFGGMVQVVDQLRVKYGATQARSIEVAWNGIGDWLG
jgi:hypothetical protein